MNALLLSLAGLIVPVLVNAVLKWAQGNVDVARATTDGANASTAAANKVSADVQSKMFDANAQPRSADLAAERLRDGSF
jgi:hypothetical protein